MEKCVSCGRTENEVKLFDGFYVSGSVRMCERCSLLNGVPIVKRPSSGQLKDADKPYGVRSRLMELAHMNASEKKEKSPYELLKEIESKPELEQPEDLVFQLVDNFHWIIQTERRRKGYTLSQLAGAIHESENAIKLLEKGIIPSKSLDLIQSIEQFLKIRLVKRDHFENLEEQRKTEILLNSSQNAPRPNPLLKESLNAISKKESNQFKIRELERQNEVIDHDFSFPSKSAAQVGKEQVEDMGKEDTARIKKTIYKDTVKPKSGTPSIYDLMKQKEEREKTSITGKDIQIVNDSCNRNKEINM